MRTLVALLLSLMVSNAWAADKGKKSCEGGLDSQKAAATTAQKKNPDYILIPSGRDHDTIPQYEEFVEVLNKTGGVLDQLGIPRTHQIVEYLKGTDLNAMISTMGGYPKAHYLDGSNIVKAYMDTSSLIYEVVYPGPKIQHGFYRDDNPVEQQKSILLHVVGHNHFATSSVFPHYRVTHVIEEAHELNRVMTKAYTGHNKDEVQRWYLFMTTLLRMQDYHSAYYQPIEDFEPKSPEQFNPRYQADIDMGKKGLLSNPRSPTENVLQAFIANLPANGSKWKREIAEAMSKMTGYQPALVHTQVMNEGWASLMQELVIKHMGSQLNFNHAVNATKVTTYSDYPDIHDPYWLGVQAWRRLYDKFRARPEYHGKTELEIDHAFIQYADKEIISKMDDYQFLKLGLDKIWLEKQKFALVRRAEPEEHDWDLPPPDPDIENPAQYILTTRDHEKILNSILRDVVFNKTRFTPRVRLMDFQRQGGGEVELVLNDEVSNVLPINIRTLAPALYSLSQIIDRPVSLECMVRNPRWVNTERRWDMWMSHEEEEFEEIGSNEPELIRVRTVVSPNGNLQAYFVGTDDKEKRFEVMDKQVQDLQDKVLDRYLVDLYLEDDTRTEWMLASNPRMQDLATQMVAQLGNHGNITELVDHVPSVASALEEYNGMLKRRLLRAMENAFKGNGGLVRTKFGMYLKALPSSVMLQFDRKAVNKMLRASLSTVPKVATLPNITKQLPYSKKMVGFARLIGPVDEGQEGDHLWGPGDPPPGEDGDEGDEGDEPGDPQDGPPGDAITDPSWVPIPDDLYAQFLGERVKLPNLNPKPGESKDFRTKLHGKRNQKDGVLRTADTAMNALKKGIGAVTAAGDDPMEDILDTVEQGFSYMQPRDFVVKNKKIIPKPNMNAVVTFLLDASGSTWAFYPRYKRFVYDLKALLKREYPHVEFRYVIFDSEAHIMKDEEEFFKTLLGGGTSYVAGIEKVHKLYEMDYPRNRWDRFTFVMGDIADMPPEPILESLNKLIADSEYAGVVKAGFGVPELEHALLQNSEENEFMGYVDLGSDPKFPYSVDHIRKLLKNKDE